MDKDSLKEYYVKLQNLYNNAVNMLTAINQSLSTTSSEISITISGNDDTKTSVRIPSFLYLENKIEQLSNNFSNLFEMPSSGNAWFSNENNMYKLKMVQSNVAPIKPQVSTNSLQAGLKQNIFLKDLVNPRTFLKISIDNIPNNVEKIYVKKIVIFNPNVFTELENRKDNLKSYQDYVAALANLTEGVDYEEYDTTVAMPIKREEYDSEFRIIDIPTLESGNPYYSSNIENPLSSHNDSHLVYEVRLNTLIYKDHDDPSIEYQLKVGDQLSLQDNFTIYKIKNISKYQDSVNESLVTLEEIAGHTALQTYDANSSMILKMYKSNYNEYNYVEVPLEENDYLVLFLSLIDSNVRSSFSDPIQVNLNNIYMYNENGTLMKDPKTGQNISYISYYNQFCTNIGDIIQGISDTIYPQFSNINNSVLNTLQNNDTVQTIVTDSINKEYIEVTCINEHIFDDESGKEISDLYAEKNKYLMSINDIQANIDSTYNLLVTTDFSSNSTLSQESLKAQLDNYYSQRSTLNKEYIMVVNRIAALKAESDIGSTSKYRIRGFFDTDIIQKYIKDNVSDKCDIIGIDVEYKYVSVSSNQASVTQIANNVFSNWNKYKTIDKERILKFDDNDIYSIDYVEYSNSDNNVKWNQVDIPITQGEDVVIRIRYKYNIGQPFMNFYSPWSDDITFEFPEKYANKNEIVDIVSSNDDDVMNAKFMSTLINDGYDEHIANKIVDNSQTYYHMPENIYSGFNTAENKLISLKDKLTSMSNDIDKYKSILNINSGENYIVYLEYDNNTIELNNSTANTIRFNDSQNANTDFYIKKKMNIIIKNIGESALNLYSIFSGDTSIPLLNVYDENLVSTIANYQRVPLLLDGSDSLDDVYAQTLGQWIYFRQNNPYNKQSMYYSSTQQNSLDISTMIQNSNIENKSKYVYMSSNISCWNKNNKQVLLPNKDKTNSLNPSIDVETVIQNASMCASLSIVNGKVTYSGKNSVTESNASNIFNAENADEQTLYNIDNGSKNLYAIKYAHFSAENSEGKEVHFTSDLAITDFISLEPINIGNNKAALNGGFLYPEIPSDSYLLCSTKDLTKQYKTIPAGSSLSIPIVFEYLLDSTNTEGAINSIEKTICFDLRPSIDKEYDHYILTIIANKNAIILDEIDNTSTISSSIDSIN